MTRRAWGAAALVAATYGYFLLFAEFAFLELVLPATSGGGEMRAVMGMLGAGGVTGSLLAASRAIRLAEWLLGCALAAGAALVAPRWGMAGLMAAGAFTGFSLGGATVALAAGLRGLAGGRQLGLVAGLGTGAAYAACNLPWIFEASPAVQTGLAAAAAGLAAELARRLMPARRAAPAADGTTEGRRGEVGRWTAIFLALVWMDSAAFYIIQHTEALKDATWRGELALGGNAAMHLAAAVAAGYALDRGRAGSVAALAALSLAGACAWIAKPGAELAYVAGVSLYSVALVYVPARMERASAAAAIFSVAGWGGSALGIGMAQDMHGIPAWFGPAALSLVLAGLALRRQAGTVLAAGLAAVTLVPPPGEAAEAAGAAALRGREVYVAEGCIHCHSQYVRPGTEDVPRWGPALPLDELLRQRPPLPGNRRQGPDLLNVGNRRTPEWNRLHLIDPRAVSPGSRMPSYAPLFAAGETRGDDLIVYLASLGAGTEGRRAAGIAAWRPSPAAKADPAAGATLFARFCAQCHGSGGQGDGALAPKLKPRPADLTRSEMGRDGERLARLIKFGRPGTAMAGHEALADDAVVSLARHVAGLQAAEAKP